MHKFNVLWLNRNSNLFLYFSNQSFRWNLTCINVSGGNLIITILISSIAPASKRKTHRLTPGVSSVTAVTSVKQRCCLTSIIFTLFGNIEFNSFCGDADRRDKIAVRPKTIGTPVVLFEFGKLLFDISSEVGFNEANHCTNRLLWWDRDEDMVFVVIRLFDIDVGIVFGDFE